MRFAAVDNEQQQLLFFQDSLGQKREENLLKMSTISLTMPHSISIQLFLARSIEFGKLFLSNGEEKKTSSIY